MFSGMDYKKRKLKIEENSIVFVICSMLVIVATMFWPSNMLVMTWHVFVPYVLSALAGTFMIFYFSKKILLYRRISRALTYVGDNTLLILTWHFLFFKLVSFLLILYYTLPIARLAEFPVIEEYAYNGWWLLYLMMGIVLPLLTLPLKNLFMNIVNNCFSHN